MTMGITILETPVKSEGDKKDYRLIKLSNGIKVLLIKENDENDDSGDNLAAALAVRVGSFDDPPHAMGLAHFLEHVVFMGSEKYPVENSFDDFVATNGGFDSATTKSESTIYSFHVSKHISRALDMFADQFRAPLLTKDSMRRERESVDSEFHELDSSDDDHLGFILKTLINENHPASQFNIGNLKTLRDNISDDELHKELVKLHSKYVGKKMYLAVQSNRSLDDLQEIVVERFTAIKAGDDEDEKSSIRIEEIFKPEFYSKIFYMKPKLPRKTLRVTWILPSLMKHYKTSPLSYIFSNIFLWKGEGGLQSYLKNHKLISMMSSSQSYNSCYEMPYLQFYLDYGVANVNRILEALFSYLLMLKETPLSEHRRLYTEISEMEAVLFKFHYESRGISNVESYVRSMLFADNSDILRVRSQKLLFFDENIIGQVIELLNETKFNITIMNDEHRSFNKREKYFGTEYEEKDFPEEYQKLWDERKLNPEFYLEKSNPFRTTNFEIFVNEDESPKYPAKIFEDNVFEVWHKLDDKFKTPRAMVHINLLSPKQMTSIQSFLYLSFYNLMATKHLEKSLSQPMRAGLNYYMSGEGKAFIINLSVYLSGYNDKMEAFAELFMTELKKSHESMDNSRFEMVKTHIKEWYLFTLLESDNLADEFLMKCIRNGFYSDLELFNEINNVTLENLQKFAEKFYQKMKIQILVQGNMTKSQALRIVNIVQSHLPCEALDDEYELKCRNYQMPLGSSVLRMKSLRKNNKNSAIKNYYQTGKRTLRSSNLLRLIASILETRAFDFLRNKEQLGYDVSCSYYQSEGGYLGLRVDVLFQESKHSFKEVYEKMKFFMTNIAKTTIEELTDEEIESFKDAKIKNLLGNHKNILEEVSKNWNEITDQDYIFNRNELSAKMLKTLTKSDVQEFFNSFTKQENLRLLSVQVVGHMDNDHDELDMKSVGKIDLQISTDKITEDENLISDIESFHESIVLYPITKFEVE